MAPSHASKGALRYRYYVSVEPDGGKPSRPQRIAAGDVEQSVIRGIRALLADHNHLIRILAVEAGNAASAALSEAQALGQAIATSPPAQDRKSPVSGKTVSTRVDPGSPRTINKPTTSQ